MPAITQICIDLDGVLCDFILPTLRLFSDDPQSLLNRWPIGQERDGDGRYAVLDLLGVKTKEFWDTVDKAGFQHWANLPRYPWATELMNACKAIAPTVVLTTPSRHVNSVKGKVCWLQRHFGMKFDGYLIGTAKHFCARPGSLLIDDSDLNCNKFREHGGEAIVFPQPWNSRHTDYPHGATVVIEDLQQSFTSAAA